jgi:hypothetical protein
MEELPEYVDGLPNLCGSEQTVEAAIAAGRDQRVFLGPRSVDIAGIDSAFAIALHMHQPLIPAGGPDPRTAAIVGNLQWMLEHLHVGDNHNAPVFHWCYKRMGELIPQLLAEGKQPRIMLEYSGTLLHGLRRAGLDDIFDALRPLTSDPDLRHAVEWLGSPWGHAVAPSTPVQDYRLHVRAWQHHFAAIFGLEALGRVRGFSPAEMALPNHPDVAYEFVKILNDCGYRWLLVQEHTVELPDGRPLEHPHLPHRLVATSSHGDTAEIIAVVKTQGSDTKLVAQMQPYDEAKGLSRVELAGRRVPPLVTQIADGENGGVMMNEFPPKYLRRFRDGARNRWPLRGSSRSRRHEQPQASNPRWPTRGGTPYGPGPGRGVCALPLRATGRRCWNASWVGTPYGPSRDEVSASPSQRCAVEDVGAAAPPLHADVLLHSSA